jgi:hypothetical protein
VIGVCGGNVHRLDMRAAGTYCCRCFTEQHDFLKQQHMNSCSAARLLRLHQRKACCGSEQVADDVAACEAVNIVQPAHGKLCNLQQTQTSDMAGLRWLVSDLMH